MTTAGSGRAQHDHPARALLVLAYVLLCYSLAQTSLLPALPEMTTSLHASASGAAWLFSGFFLSATVTTTIIGRLGDIYGRRLFAIVAMTAFGSGAAVVAVTSSLWIAVGGRVLQGVGAGVFPLCFSLVRGLYPPNAIGRNIGLLSGMAGLGSALGLLLGGVLVDRASYHWLFWANAGAAFAGCLLLRLVVPESRAPAGEPLDARGAAVLALGLGALLFGVSRASAWGWGSPRTLGLIAAGAVVLALWTRLELRTDHPLVDIASLRSRPVLLTNVATVLVGYGMLASFVLLAPLGQAPTSTGYGLGLSAMGIALVATPGALAMAIMGPLAGSWGARSGNKLPLAGGSALVAAGFASLAVEHSSLVAVVVGSTVLSAGVSVAYAGLTNLIIEETEPQRTAEATGANSVAMRAGMTFGSQVSATILAGSVAAGASYPSDEAFVVAFAIGGGLALAAGAIALVIPARRRAVRTVTLEVASAADG